MLSSQDIMGFTCLHLAAKLGHYDIIHLLLSKASKYINCQVKRRRHSLAAPKSSMEELWCEFSSFCVCRTMEGGPPSPGPLSTSTKSWSTCCWPKEPMSTSETRLVPPVPHTQQKFLLTRVRPWDAFLKTCK